MVGSAGPEHGPLRSRQIEAECVSLVGHKSIAGRAVGHVGFDGRAGGENRFHPAADTRGDWLLDGATPFSNALRRSLDGARR
jgi:hypothetical protein